MIRLIEFINIEFSELEGTDKRYEAFAKLSGVSKRTVYLSIKSDDHYVVTHRGCCKLVKVKKEFIK